MNPHFDYCRDKAAPAGSNFYYSILFENKDSKAILIPLYALHNEFIDCLTASPDPGVTRLKFNWWHEELSRLSENVPRHPVTQAIQTLCVNNPELISLIHGHLVFIESIISTAHQNNYQDWMQLNINGLGNYWLALNLPEQEHSSSELLTTNGGLIFVLELFSIYPLFVDKSPGFLPAELMAKHSSTNREDLYSGIFAEILPDLHDNLDKVYKNLKTVNPKPAKFNLILNRIAKAICHEIILDGNHIMKRKLQLTPIRKLWISYCVRLSSQAHGF